MRLISHPFRVETNGTIATTDQGSDLSYKEQIAVLMLTRVGERVLVPAFGITDPAFDRVDKAELINKIKMFGPPVTITNVIERFTSPTTVEVRVDFA